MHGVTEEDQRAFTGFQRLQEGVFNQYLQEVVDLSVQVANDHGCQIDRQFQQAAGVIQRVPWPERVVDELAIDVLQEKKGFLAVQRFDSRAQDLA